MRTAKTVAIILIAVGLSACNLFLAPRKTVETLDPTIDGYIDSGGATRDFFSGSMSVGTGASNFRSLIVFDDIPSKARIYSADLVLGSSGAMAATVAAARMNQSWSQSTVTWSQTLDAKDSVSVSVPMTAPEVVFPVSKIVQAWADGEDNDGFVLIGVSGSTSFGTIESITAAPPELVIVYAD